jgi:hypothetical protein
MICTMRIWHPTRQTTASSLRKSRSFGSQALHSSLVGGVNNNHLIQQGPELILNPVVHVASNHNMMIHGCCSGELGNPITISKRFASFGSANNSPDNVNKSNNTSYSIKQQPPKPKTLGAVTIPISDIMVVDMYGAGGSHRANITTMSFGYFEFTLESRNGQQVLLAFIKASLPKERVMDGQGNGYGVPRSPSQNSASTETQSFDVEAFTASRMAERVDSESFSEKLRARVVKVVSSIEESKFGEAILYTIV